MKIIIKIMIIPAAIFFSQTLLAGTPQLNIQCKGINTGASISGYARGEGFDLNIQVGKSVTRYVDKCEDVNCDKHPKQGELAVVEALNKKVFTIYFSWPVDGGPLMMGQFYALPDTVKYQKTSNGYRAEYNGIYDGTDPRSPQFPIGPLEHPIEFSCIQNEEL